MEVKVTDDAGKPIAGALVRVIDKGGKSYQLKTGAQGDAWFNLGPGVFSLEVSVSGYNSKQVTNVQVPGSRQQIALSSQQAK